MIKKIFYVGEVNIFTFGHYHVENNGDAAGDRGRTDILDAKL